MFGPKLNFVISCALLCLRSGLEIELSTGKNYGMAMRPQSYCQLSGDARNICLTLYGICHGRRHRFRFSKANDSRLVRG